ncbi:MAG TPA: radical SAM protein [bacterium]|mgnify:CR=1 FL=1|nr:radical SAM protein [bacterium]
MNKNIAAEIENDVCEESSPDYLKVSLAAAMTMDLVPGIFYRNACLHCINVLLTYDEGCKANCAYCGLQKTREGDYNDKSFIRVDWPVFKTDDVIESTLKKKDIADRICISMITHEKAKKDTFTILKRFVGELHCPVSILMAPTVLKHQDIDSFKECGANMVTVALDVATPELFDKYRGKGVNGPHRWEKYNDILEYSVSVFGKNRVGCHLVVGLGETEMEMVRRIQAVRDIGARSHLFSFYREKGSRLENHPQCPAGKYRRVQTARHIIDYDMGRVEDMIFDDEERIIDFGMPFKTVAEMIEKGVAFQTTGCPGKTEISACNRPFGDSSPKNIRSFPFALNANDVARIRKELLDYD